ncbi:MAG TPA: nitrilase-related carbon-nitrogen hydrolase [Candidatus Kapabacteria bacterium]|jgi:predicted amidohydrolase
MKIACVQFCPEYRNVEKNLDKLRFFVRSTDADLIVLPELALTGYFFKSTEEAFPFAEAVDGDLSSAIGTIAREEGKAVVIGFLEREDRRLFNAALAFDRTGMLKGHYRKVHLFYYETKVFARGNRGFPVCSLETSAGTARVGMAICYDWRFPEPFRKLAIEGAELIALPSNIVTTTGMLHATLSTRAFENKVVLAFADRIGSEELGGEQLLFRGESAIIDRNGAILSQASSREEEITVAEVDLEKTRHKRINPFNDIFGDRLPNYGI